jgi:hypothetical protein
MHVYDRLFVIITRMGFALPTGRQRELIEVVTLAHSGLPKCLIKTEKPVTLVPKKYHTMKANETASNN